MKAAGLTAAKGVAEPELPDNKMAGISIYSHDAAHNEEYLEECPCLSLCLPLPTPWMCKQMQMLSIRMRCLEHTYLYYMYKVIMVCVGGMCTLQRLASMLSSAQRLVRRVHLLTSSVRGFVVNLTLASLQLTLQNSLECDVLVQTLESTAWGQWFKHCYCCIGPSSFSCDWCASHGLSHAVSLNSDPQMPDYCVYCDIGSVCMMPCTLIVSPTIPHWSQPGPCHPYCKCQWDALPSLCNQLVMRCNCCCSLSERQP